MKKKRFLITILFVLFMVSTAFVFSSCNNNSEEKHVHSYNETVIQPTCTEQGYTTFACECGDSYDGDYVSALGHDYGEPVWSWNGYTSASATFTCNNDESHVEIVNATITSQTSGATCTENGQTVYTATVEFDGKTYTDEKTEVLNALGHSYSEDYSYDSTYHWHDATCGHNNAVVKESHVFDDWGVCIHCGFEGFMDNLSFELLEDGYNLSGVKDKTKLPSKLSIPSSYNGVAVTKIGYGCFENCTNLTEVIVPDSVTYISVAFRDCNNLEKMTLPFTGYSESSQYFNSVFGAIFGYTTIANPSGMMSSPKPLQPSYRFVDGKCGTQPSGTVWQYSCCNYQNNGMEYRIQSYYYYIPSRLKEVTITKKVSEGAFRNCGIEAVHFGEGVSIGGYAFSDCSNLNSVTISGVESIDEYAFNNCINLNSVTISGVESIGNCAFKNCINLNSVVIGDGVESIGEYAFNNCKNLNSVIILNNVTDILGSAFKQCDSITSVYYKGSVSDWGEINIRDYNSKLTDATRYYYSETTPIESGNYWHYDTDCLTPIIWE